VSGVVVRRLALLVLVLAGMSVITFVVSHLIPADPARLVAGIHASASQVETVRKEYGLDLPYPVQYVRYVSGLLRGDMGKSLVTRRPVQQDLREFFPATVELALAAILLCLLIGVPLGVLSAIYRERWLDHIMRVLALAGSSFPAFWLGLLLQLVFYRGLRLLPLGGRLELFQTPPPGVTGLYTVDSLLASDMKLFASVVTHLLLPAVTLSMAALAIMTRMTRSAMLDVLSKDYIRTARAKGLAERVVLFKHALKNALFPVLTLTGLEVGSLLGGSVLVESVFDWPGVGLYALKAVQNMDFPAIMGMTLLVSTCYVIINLIVDLSYYLVDPRTRG